MNSFHNVMQGFTDTVVEVSKSPLKAFLEGVVSQYGRMLASFVAGVVAEAFGRQYGLAPGVATTCGSVVSYASSSLFATTTSGVALTDAQSSATPSTSLLASIMEGLTSSIVWTPAGVITDSQPLEKAQSWGGWLREVHFRLIG